jgi:hypothetical protein
MFIVIAGIFILFAVSRVFNRYRDGALSWRGLLFWSIIWGVAALFIFYPAFAVDLSTRLGIGRGSDAIVYPSIIIAYYLMFRLYVQNSSHERELTRFVRALALREWETRPKK